MSLECRVIFSCEKPKRRRSSRRRRRKKKKKTFEFLKLRSFSHQAAANPVCFSAWRFYQWFLKHRGGLVWVFLEIKTWILWARQVRQHPGQPGLLLLLLPCLPRVPNAVNTLKQSWLLPLVLSSGKAFYFSAMKEPICALLWTRRTGCSGNFAAIKVPLFISPLCGTGGTTRCAQESLLRRSELLIPPPWHLGFQHFSG